MASICSGAFVLAAAGLLNGRRATTHWMHAALLAKRYPHVQVDPDVLYVDDGTILTSAGKAAGLDLCLHIVRTDHGTAVANTLARRLIVPPHRPGGQAQFIAAPLPISEDRGLADLLNWTIMHLNQPLTVNDLARQARMSPRNLTRHFNALTGTAPLQWLLTQRIHRAQELLETTDQSIEHIAYHAGMGTRPRCADTSTACSECRPTPTGAHSTTNHTQTPVRSLSHRNTQHTAPAQDQAVAAKPPAIVPAY